MKMYEVFKSGPRKGRPKKLVDRVIRYLEEELLLTEVGNPRGRRREFVHPGREEKYFVGKNGGVRVGKTVSGSRSITHAIHPRVDRWEVEHALAK
jgi:hypothetical protein